jgi:hypothetical protein
MSNGFVLAGLIGRVRDVSVFAPGVRLRVIGIVEALAGVKSVGPLPSPSPSRTNASIALSKFPPTPFSTIAFL